MALGRRKRRPGEFICSCSSYSFPHRLLGGKCSGWQWIQEYWEQSYGSGDCTHCPSFQRDEGFICEVTEGRESTLECRAFEEFLRINEVRVYNGKEKTR